MGRAVHDWTFPAPPELLLGANTVLVASLQYRSRLVPRLIAALGLAGGPLIFAAASRASGRRGDRQVGAAASECLQ
ncbi:DUF4386 family protein [Streptomyces sp. NPDC047718]|uniref:DUF4386 family protein n=1 Tax=Streptomyces sp. NPDC047718 TaxID=3155479 RepID=UPI0033F09E83